MKIAAALLVSAAVLCAQDPIRGFPEGQWPQEHTLEQRAQGLPDATRIGVYIQRMSERPHQAGSRGSASVASYLTGLLQEWGLETRTEDFNVLLPYPVTRRLEMVSPVRYKAKLEEPAIAGDRYSRESGQLPPYNAYSAAGNVTGELVYVNFGTPEDYDYLAKQHIGVKGKIAIARYGKSWRGVKAKVAAEHGAIGCIIYSDPHEDGYFQGDVYPTGALRPPGGVQRGSVMDMALYPGDPLTPGWASEKGARRLPMSEAKTLMKIPVTPISYADAAPLLKQLKGPVAPESWRGALGFTYHIGPGPATVHLQLDFDFSNRPIHDVIAMIPGSAYPDEWVIAGNHHDAWVNGAQDPGSGASALLETARSLAELHRQGWNPKRTIVFAFWDAEEFGLVGSTEWVEKHQEELTRKAVVYINSDMNAKGTLHASGSHTLEDFIGQAARDVKDPASGKSVLEVATPRHADASGAIPNRGAAPQLHIGPLGSGSDYVAFLDHVGVASLDLGFSGPNQSGVYHSAYDDYDWFKRFGDPGFSYGKALSQLTATALLRMADAPVLPFEFGGFSKTVRGYVEEIQKQSGKKVDLSPILAALAKTGADARIYETALQKALSKDSGEQFGLVNDELYRTERSLLLPKGLPGRDWYKHQIYAPGLYTGYGAKTLPGIREAVESGRWQEANEQVSCVAQVLDKFNQRIQKAATLLSR